MSKTDRKDDIVTQQQATTAALKKYAYMLDTQLDHMPIDVKTTAQYIHAHLFESSLNVNAISTASRTRNHNMTTRFRQATGKGIREYIKSRRLDAAASILSTQEVNIYLLAAAVGYTEEAFSKAFKNAYGCSPLLYHRKEMEKRITTWDSRLVPKKDDKQTTATFIK